MTLGLTLAGCLWGASSFALGGDSRLDEISTPPQSIVRAAQVVSNEESRSDTSLVMQEFRYHMPHASAVFLVWGINGWQPGPEQSRPAGTVIKDSVMHSPMVLNGETFILEAQVTRGVTVQYGFLITKMRNGSDVTVWDGTDRYVMTVFETGVTTVQSVVMVDWFGNPIDRAGLLVAILLVACFIGMVTLSVNMMLRSPPQPHEPVNSTAPLDSTSSSDHDHVRMAALVTVVFAALGFVTLWHHEMWRDELQAWHIAAASSSLRDLFANLRYEGHPAVWYMCLYALTRFSEHPFVMQILHLALATTAIYLFSRFAPFTRLQKLCFAAGYFPLYEYGIISRSYVLGVLGLFAFCVLLAHGKRGSLAPAFVLAFVANTSVFGAMIALAFAIVPVVDLLTNPKRDRTLAAQRAFLWVLIVGFAVSISIMQMVPPPDTSPRVLKWRTSLDTERLEWTLAQVWRSYVPIPTPMVSFWNSSILDRTTPWRVGSLRIDSLQVQAALSFGLLILAVRMLAQTPLIMLVFVIASAELLVFMQVKHYGGLRHAGHLFIILVACLWLSQSRTHPSSLPTPRPWQLALRTQTRTTLITILFISQTTASVIAVQSDLRFPFSAAKGVAEFLTERRLNHLPMIGSKYYVASGVALYLNRPMYYAETDRVELYTVWKSGRRRVGAADLLRKADELASHTREHVVLILNFDLGRDGDGLIKMGSFTENIISDERYVVYMKCYREPERDRSFNQSSDLSGERSPDREPHVCS